jgi:hypothetical protein
MDFVHGQLSIVSRFVFDDDRRIHPHDASDRRLTNLKGSGLVPGSLKAAHAVGLPKTIWL